MGSVHKHWQKVRNKLVSHFSNIHIRKNIPHSVRAAISIMILTIIFIVTHVLQLKALDIFGMCQRPVLSLGVSKYMH